MTDPEMTAMARRLLDWYSAIYHVGTPHQRAEIIAKCAEELEREFCEHALQLMYPAQSDCDRA